MRLGNSTEDKDADAENFVYVVVQGGDDGQSEDKKWRIHRMELSRISEHGRNDTQAVCDFIRAAWVYARHYGDQPDMSLIKKTDEQIKMMDYCKRTGRQLLDALGIHHPVQFHELIKAITPHTSPLRR
ncbi:hypothetical protein BIWAKO_03851 [Bosea sp. BIWAKO-01]|nr:hypothetical protein BIWAKO_03851 [Bosea sp. BIWAKO-01]